MDGTVAAPPGCRPAVYARHRPERAVLYRLVQEHLETCLALERHGNWDGQRVPASMEREFRRSLWCGILAWGFCRARCTARGDRVPGDQGVGSNSSQERKHLIEVSWAAPDLEAAHPVDLVVLAVDRKGLLRDASSVITNEDLDVVGVSTHSDPDTGAATMRFTVEVHNADQLE